jgi:hypothetical protein
MPVVIVAGGRVVSIALLRGALQSCSKNAAGASALSILTGSRTNPRIPIGLCDFGQIPPLLINQHSSDRSNSYGLHTFAASINSRGT